MKKKIKHAVKRVVMNLCNIEAAASTESTSPLQVYTGYEETDFPVIRQFASSIATVGADHYTDGFGVKTLYQCVPFVSPGMLNTGRLAFPVPDDGFHAEAIEYVALTDALHRSADSDSFCAVEIGAGWAPWITAAGVIGRKQGKQKISLVGVEASSDRFPLMCHHLETNDLRPIGTATDDARHKNVFSRLFNGAVWTHDGEIWFPESDVADMGSAASPSNDNTDYRGTKADNKSVPCRKLETLLQDLGQIDFMHIDIQGSELELLQDQIDWVSSNVKTMMIATHSRPIEGGLMNLLFDNGWQLHREKPCRVDWYKSCTIVGRTIVDGSQYWLNRKFDQPLSSN